MMTDKTAAGRRATRESGNQSTTVGNRLITMEDKEAGKQSQQTRGNINSGERSFSSTLFPSFSLSQKKIT